MISLKENISTIRRDAMAGTVTGFMAVPLTIGICIMSDYPIMLGLYTVIFAGVISYVTYLFKPGNYTGMPGVAAGLAPALAFGVSEFGFENMPFVIFLTASFQAFVWRLKLEKYIFRLVPHYLIEGLLAGVGLKITLKFIPFLYDIEHETDVWLNLEREAVIFLSLFSFLSFVLLYKYYQKKIPALPYLIIIISSIALCFVMPLPRIHVDAIPFELQFPFPHFSELNSDTLFLLFKMMAFAIMLGSIDIIEQVMSHVAIAKMDPLKRKSNINNGILPIWIANLGASFFGGMTNLDGLAKSTTNTVAGARTKLSNLFTAIFLLLIVTFPILITFIPEYALGIIMVYSGWKMIANIAHVKTEGRYAIMMAGLCCLLVFEFGIFEGLLMLLFLHALIQFIFMKKHGHSNAGIWRQFKKTIAKEKPINLEKMETKVDSSVPILKKWIEAFNSQDLKLLVSLYDEKAVLISALSLEVYYSKNDILAHYKEIFENNKLQLRLENIMTKTSNGLKIDTGILSLKNTSQNQKSEKAVRFSLVIHNQLIITDHTSINN